MFQEINPNYVHALVKQNFRHDSAARRVGEILDNIQRSVEEYFKNPKDESEEEKYSLSMQSVLETADTIGMTTDDLLEEMKKYATAKNYNFDEFLPGIREQIAIHETYLEAEKQLNNAVQDAVTQFVASLEEMKRAGKMAKFMDPNDRLIHALDTEESELTQKLVKNALAALRASETSADSTEGE